MKFYTFHYLLQRLIARAWPVAPCDKKWGRLLFASLYHTSMNIWVITVGRGGAKAAEDRRADVLRLQAQVRTGRPASIFKE